MTLFCKDSVHQQNNDHPQMSYYCQKTTDVGKSFRWHRFWRLHKLIELREVPSNGWQPLKETALWKIMRYCPHWYFICKTNDCIIIYILWTFAVCIWLFCVYDLKPMYINFMTPLPLLQLENPHSKQLPLLWRELRKSIDSAQKITRLPSLTKRGKSYLDSYFQVGFYKLLYQWFWELFSWLSPNLQRRFMRNTVGCFLETNYSTFIHIEFDNSRSTPNFLPYQTWYGVP